VQLIDVYQLKRQLNNQKQVLSLKQNPYGIWNDKDNIVIDNTMKGFVSFTGDWSVNETTHTGRYEMNFRLLPAGETGDFEYLPYFFQTGEYEVFIWHPASEEYETAVTVRILNASGNENVMLDQSAHGGKWKKLGNYTFEKGRQRALIIHAVDYKRSVVADAVKFTYVGKGK
jgi:hypothetical protein